ncbi:hypothetical protein [Saccharothrix deserti]|uniref:hypothetical protein n=1 Tax=Saccharothrix deserti TaxID=2593674 RepID=UPI00131D5BD7|nr:hypothetical protein [Saccharothrix deserti]
MTTTSGYSGAGGLLRDRIGAASQPWSALVLVAPVLVVVVATRFSGFPVARR